MKENSKNAAWRYHYIIQVFKNVIYLGIDNNDDVFVLATWTVRKLLWKERLFKEIFISKDKESINQRRACVNCEIIVNNDVMINILHIEQYFT